MKVGLHPLAAGGAEGMGLDAAASPEPLSAKLHQDGFTNVNYPPR